MTNNTMTSKVLFASLLMAAGLPVGATTLVHYTMENLPKASYAAGSTIPDVSPSGAYPATLAEYAYGTHAYYVPVVETSSGFAGNGIRDGVTGTTSLNKAVLTFTQANDKFDGHGAALRVEEAAGDTTLHLQTFTVEFMWKCAVSSQRWAAPLSRLRVDPANPPVVRDGTEASTLTMFINNAEGRPVQCIVATQAGGGTSVKTLTLGSGAGIVDGAWHHVALTLDGTTHMLTLFADGKPIGAATLDGPLVYQDANPWVFGGHGYDGWQAGGSMDEIRISDKVLAPSEFLQVVQADVREPYLALDDADVKHPRERDRLRESWQKVGDSFVRKLAVITKGRLEFRTVFTAPNGLPVKIEFLGPDRRPVWSGTSKGGEFRAAFDVAQPIAYLRVTPGLPTDAWDVMRMPLRISVDHALDETFTFTPFGQLPGGWTGTASVVTNCMVSPGAWDARGVDSDPFLAVGPGGSAEVRFTPEEGKYAVSFQTYAHVRSALWVTLPNGRKVSLRGTDFVFSEASEGGLRYRATEGVWYTLRFEIDPAARKTLVKLNGRALGTLSGGGADGGRLAFANTGTIASCVDDVKVRALPEFADGVPEPVVPRDTKGNVVGMNICSLWHEGSHLGWDCVSHCDSPRPVLGFYDEGEGESADWEIKYMVEHGIDFQAFCWYADKWTGPIKHPSLAYQLDDGFKNAKWSSKMSYCLIWECANAAVPYNFDVWRTYYVPYFIEHHFKDPRHLKIKNRIPLFVFGGGWHLANRFGGADKMRVAFDYLENEVKKLGFDGMIYVLSHDRSNPDYAKMGYDATAAYNWGVNGWSYDVNTNCNWSNSKDRSCFTIPTVSVGFNNEPWGGDSRPMMTPADFAKSLAWARDVFSPATAAKGTWQEKLFMISTWNEYGEGTYIMPTQDERGFGYLDAVRSVFTDEKPDPKLNLVPTSRQLKRINRMFRAEPESVWGDVVTSWTFADGDTHGWTVVMGVEGVHGTSQGLAFKTTTTDPALAVWFSPFLAKRFKEVVVRLKTTAKSGALQLFWTKPGGKASEGASVAVPIVADEKVREYVLPVATCPAWRGRIGSLRLDTGNTPGDCFTLESVRMR